MITFGKNNGFSGIKPREEPVVIPRNQPIPHIVTSDQVNQHSQGKQFQSSLTIFDIAQNEDLRKKFAKSVFPEFQITSNGNLFFTPTAIIRSPIETVRVKWFTLDKYLSVSHDHDYPSVSLIPDGFFMKVSTHPSFEGIIDFEIDYLINVMNIETVTIMERGSNTSLSSPEMIADTPVQKLSLPQFNPHAYPKMFNVLLNKEEFIQSYLQDLLDEEY